MSKIFCVLYHIQPLCIFSINVQPIISLQSLSSQHKDTDQPSSLLSKMCVCQIKQTSVIPITGRARAGEIPVGCQPASPTVVGRVENRINERPPPAISILHKSSWEDRTPQPSWEDLNVHLVIIANYSQTTPEQDQCVTSGFTLVTGARHSDSFPFFNH